MYKHFRKDEAHRKSTLEELLEVQIIEKIYDLDKVEQLDQKFTERRLMREYYWMVTLFTIYPYGLNDKVKGFGNIWSNQEVRHKFNHHKAFKSIHILMPKTRKRKRRKVITGDTLRKTEHFFNEIQRENVIDRIHIRHLLQSQSKRVLNAIFRDGRFENLASAIKIMLTRWRDNQLDESIGQLFIKKVDIRKRLFLKIEFENKWIEKIRFASIFNRIEVKNKIPSTCKYLVPPVIIYTYGRNIGSHILNYSKELRNSNIERYSEIEEMSCSCARSPFINNHFGHVISGDLNIIENEELRNLMNKGTKFRESPNPNFRKMEEQIIEALEVYVQKWSDKERMDVENFTSWKRKVIALVNIKLAQLKAKCRRYQQTGEILQKPAIKAALEELHRKYVICMVDKASNNFAIMCKKFYFMNQGKELGLDSGRFGNETYLGIDESEDQLCLRLKDEISRKFDILVPDDYLKLPVLYWIPKFHKNPIKFRFIAGSKNKVLTLLEVEIQKILNLLESHFKNYCEVIRQNSGYKYYFSINNTRQALDMLENVENPSSFDSFDFSNLYTNFKHEDLIDKFRILLDLLFKNAERKNKGDSIRTEKHDKGRARWCTINEGNLAKYRGQKFWTKYKILEAIEFLIKNAHIKFGKLIFRQICGIPMGMIPAPGLAKLGLGIDEFNYCSKMVRDGRIDVLKRLINMIRYIDDIGVANFSNFADIAKDIYPASLTLNKSNESGTMNSAFLDLKVSVIHDQFRVQVYNKTDDYNFRVIVFPYLESNILTDICYSVFFGEILRYLRICTRLEDFENRARMLVSLLTQRGYKRSELSKQFIKLFLRYKCEVRKYPGIINAGDSMQRVIYHPFIQS